MRRLLLKYWINPMDLPTEFVLFGGTSGMHRVREEVERALSCDLPVLIRGESGTGKTTMAQYIHSRSNRSSLPFLKLSCAAVSSEQAETALFGSAESAGDGLKPFGINQLLRERGSTLLLEDAGAIDQGLQRKIRCWLREMNCNCVKGDVVRVSQMRVICTAGCGIEGSGGGDRAFDQLLDQGGFLTLSLLAGHPEFPKSETAQSSSQAPSDCPANPNPSVAGACRARCALPVSRTVEQPYARGNRKSQEYPVCDRVTPIKKV